MGRAGSLNVVLLGSFLGSSGGPGGEFLYSTPGYLALIDAAALVGGIGVSVPLNTQYQNDLGALKSKVNAKTRAIYLHRFFKRPITVIRQKENTLKELEALQKCLPFAASETSYGMGWKGMQAARNKAPPGEFSAMAAPSTHMLVLSIRRRKRWICDMRG